MQDDNIEIPLVAQAIGLWLIMFLTFYPVGVLISADFNLGDWNTVARGFLVVIWFIFSIIGSITWYFIQLDKKGK